MEYVLIKDIRNLVIGNSYDVKYGYTDINKSKRYTVRDSEFSVDRTTIRIAEIAKLQNDLNNELSTLKEACSHDEYYVGTYSWRVGSYDQCRICTKSNLRIGQGTKIYKRL